MQRQTSIGHVTEELYRDSVYEIIDAIGTYQKQDTRYNTSMAARYVMNTIVNLPEGVEPTVTFTTPILDLFNFAHDYMPQPKDEFASCHWLMMNLVDTYDSNLREVQNLQERHHVHFDDQTTQRIVLNNAAEEWGHDYGHSIREHYAALQLLRKPAQLQVA